MLTFRNLLACFAISIVVSSPLNAQGGDTPEKIRQSVVVAGEKYRAGKIDEAKKGLGEAAERLQKLVATNPDARTLKSLKTLHEGLTTAYQKLELDGVVMEPLPAWDKLMQVKSKSKGGPDTTKPNVPAADQVNFATDVAPMLVSKCGRCHVTDAKGGFAMPNLVALMKGSKDGVVIMARDADHSRIVEVIESGDMPRGGGKVSPGDLEKLKKWINQGATFDPRQASVGLATLAGNAKSDPSEGQMAKMAIKKPTGKESISFAKDVAPILIATCAGCHYNAQQLQGQLNMNTFEQLWKGGESGSMIQPGKADESLLVKMLRGTNGKRMPQGRPALKTEEIDKIATWINEGAAFDGYSTDARMENVATQAWAESATPEEMTARRKQRAMEKWKTAFSKVEPAQTSDKDFVVLGDVGERGVEQVLAATQSAFEKVRKAIKIDPDDPLAKGGVTIFAIKSRYDYGEFGKMNESRALPPQWTSHWRRAVVDVYIVLLYDSKDPKVNEANLTQQLASLWMSSNKGTPNWFADGYGRAILAMIGGRSEPKVKAWDQQLPIAIQGLASPKDLIDNKLNEEDAAVLGYALVRKMIDSSGRKPFDSFMRALEKSHDFDVAFKQTLGPLEQTLGATFGRNAKSKGKNDR